LSVGHHSFLQGNEGIDNLKGGSGKIRTVPIAVEVIDSELSGSVIEDGEGSFDMVVRKVSSKGIVNIDIIWRTGKEG